MEEKKSIMEHIFIPGSSNGCNHRFYRHKQIFYNSKVQAISRGGGDCHKHYGCLCALFYIGEPIKTQLKIGMIKLFNLRGHIIDVYDQAVFTLNDQGLHDEQGKKINISGLLTAFQRLSGRFLSFMMTVHLYQDNSNLKHICTTCSACVQL